MWEPLSNNIREEGDGYITYKSVSNGKQSTRKHIAQIEKDTCCQIFGHHIGKR